MDNQNILAVVAGEEITQKDLDALIAALPKEQQAYAGNEHFRNQCLEQIITVHLFAKLGEELKLEETEAFADNLAHAKREILAQMALGEAMKDITVSEEEAKEYLQYPFVIQDDFRITWNFGLKTTYLKRKFNLES